MIMAFFVESSFRFLPDNNTVSRADEIALRCVPGLHTGGVSYICAMQT